MHRYALVALVRRRAGRVGSVGRVGRRAARRFGVAATACAALAATLGPLSPTAAAAPEPPGDETVVPAARRVGHVSVSLFAANNGRGAEGAGAQGVFHRLEGHRGLVWTRYADGETFPAPEGMTPPAARGTGSDTLVRQTRDSEVELWDAVRRTSRTLRIPQGQHYVEAYGTTVVTSTAPTAAEAGARHHLLTPGEDGATRDVTVRGLPEGGAFGELVGGDATSLFFRGEVGGTARLIGVDARTGEVGAVSAPLPGGAPYHAAWSGSTSRCTAATTPPPSSSTAPTWPRLPCRPGWRPRPSPSGTTSRSWATGWCT
ncbi:hypothetical protein [Streptomyces sp. G45]|uniref:hypothetical protein n=1 Tax=Streptomyces sp. G45 TaxID=3406627 RepID=UPI003C228460